MPKKERLDIPEKAYQEAIKKICDSFDLLGFRKIVDDAIEDAGIIQTEENVETYHLWRDRIYHDLTFNIFHSGFFERQRQLQERMQKERIQWPFPLVRGNVETQKKTTIGNTPNV